MSANLTSRQSVYRSFFMAALSAAALACVAAPLPAQADNIVTYWFNPTIDTPNYDKDDVISGSFTWDATTGKIDTVDFTVTGGYMAGTYDLVDNTGTAGKEQSSTEILSCLSGSACGNYGEVLQIFFQKGANGIGINGYGPDAIIGVEWDGGNDVAPQNDPMAVVPEPASLLLMGSALLGLGVIRRRRRGTTA